jgi:hypothetical protein
MHSRITPVLKFASRSRLSPLALPILFLGVTARYVVSSRGYNTDFYLWEVFARIVQTGGNVYVETPGYTYGPVWFLILDVLWQIALVFANHENVFRHLIIGLLSFADIGIAIVIWKKFGGLPAAFFFLNPVSIIISGYHNQIDNVSILLALLAVIVFGEDFSKPINLRKLCGLLFMGLSLMTKHVFFAFPLWLAVKQKGLFQKGLVVALPVSVFLIGFVPWWAVGHEGIVNNVFLQQSVNNAPFWTWYLPKIIQEFLPARTFFFLAMGLGAFAFKRRSNGGLR